MIAKKLSQRKCEACEGGIPPIPKVRAEEHMKELSAGWRLSDDATSLSREMQFENFVSVIEFVNKVAVLAEAEGHHPDLHIHGWKYLGITLSTHAISGLSLNDFIMAAKIDQL